MSASVHAVVADKLFDGYVVHQHAAALIDGARILGIEKRNELSSDIPRVDLPDGAWLAPGFIDIQVNGGGDMLFNDDPTPETIHAIRSAHRRFGTTAMLPTLISDTEEKMRHAAAAVAEAMRTDPGVLGIHYEGPFLSTQRPGVHDPGMLRGPAKADSQLLTLLSAGRTLVTLAPECVPSGFIADLRARGAIVFLGHSMATYEQTLAAIAEGLAGFTHLFNAMRPLTARDPGPIPAALQTQTAWYSIIVDGIHVAPAALRLALRGAGRPILITDAMPPVGGNKSSFTLYGNDIRVADGRCTRADGTLAGAMLDMASAVKNCTSLLGVPLPLALRLASAAPAELLGLDRQLGSIAAGYRADLVAFDPDGMRVLDTWVAGQRSATDPV